MLTEWRDSPHETKAIAQPVFMTECPGVRLVEKGKSDAGHQELVSKQA